MPTNPGATSALLDGPTFITNGGTETYLLFQQGFPLREGCGFEVFDDDAAWERLRHGYLDGILEAAAANGHGLLLDATVWRAHPDYLAALGYAPGDLVRVNERAVARTRAAVASWRCGAPPRGTDLPVLVAADVGPRGDGYRVADREVTADAACAYHRAQIEVVARAGVDLVCALTMTSANEAIGVVRAAAASGLAIVVSPTVETDGRLPDGTTLGDAVRRVDDATAGTPLFYMVNCAHPAHVMPALEAAAAAGAPWLGRFRGFRANASRKSHAELDESSALDRGDPIALGREVAALQRAYDLRVVGGCCGTDAEHIAAIAAATRRA